MIAIVRSLVFYGAFYLGSVPFVVLALLAVSVAPRRVGPVARAWSAYHRFCLRYLTGIVAMESGQRPLRPVLYAIKHESFFEAIDLPCLFDSPVVFAKRELYSIPGWGRVALAYGTIPVAREGGAKALRTMLKQARDYIATGRPLVIFPEGTRVPHGHRPPLQAGFAALYKMLGLPVVPVAVNSGPVYHRKWKRPGTIAIRFGEPIEPGLPRAEMEARVVDAINALND